MGKRLARQSAAFCLLTELRNKTGRACCFDVWILSDVAAGEGFLGTGAPWRRMSILSYKS